jgi:hypothetical protein
MTSETTGLAHDPTEVICELDARIGEVGDGVWTL